MAYVNIGQILYPVGAVYTSTKNTSPSSIFGGTWSQITNAALRGSTSTGYTGNDTCTLTENQIPVHAHRAAQNSNANDYMFTLNRTWNLAATGRLQIALNGSSKHYVMGTNIQEPDSIGTNDIYQASYTANTGGGGSTFNCATLLQLFYVVSHRLISQVM